MSGFNDSKTLKVILSVIAGAACAIIVFVMCIFIAFATGLFGWSDGGDKEYLKRLETTTNLSVIVSVIFAVFVGVLVIIKINKPSLK